MRLIRAVRSFAAALRASRALGRASRKRRHGKPAEALAVALEGFALFVAADDAERAVAVAAAQGVPAWVCGRVERGPKCVVIEPLDVRFDAESLALR